MTLTAAERIKQATATAHVDTERSLIKWLKRVETKEAYGHILWVFYHFFSPLEQAIQHQLSPLELPRLQQRTRAHLILEDYARLGLQMGAATTSTPLPAADNALQALGVMYVLEGSSLGGQHIAQMLRQQSDLAGAVQFFNGYGGETDQMWHEFRQFLNRFIQTEAELQTVAAAAIHTFTLLNQRLLNQSDERNHSHQL